MTRRNAGEGSIRERHPGQWEARYKATDGRYVSLYGKTKREVTDKLRQALRAADNGLAPLSATFTVGQWLDRWLDDHVEPSLRPRTSASYRDTVERYLKPNLGDVVLSKLAPEQVVRMLRALEAREPRLSPTTVRYALVVLRIALGRAVKQGKLHRNVATLVDGPAPAERHVTPMSPEQARAVLGAVRGRPLEPLYRLALATGLRQGELLALRWQTSTWIVLSSP